MLTVEPEFRRPILVALVLTLIGLAILTFDTGAGAQTTQKYQQLTVAATSIGITETTLTGMAGCVLKLETAQIRWRGDGTAPTTAVGMVMDIGDTTDVMHVDDVRLMRFIRTGATSGTLNVVCFPRR